MNKAQLIAFYFVAGVAVVAFLESQKVKAALAGMLSGGGVGQSGDILT